MHLKLLQKLCELIYRYIDFCTEYELAVHIKLRFRPSILDYDIQLDEDQIKHDIQFHILLLDKPIFKWRILTG